MELSFSNSQPFSRESCSFSARTEFASILKDIDPSLEPGAISAAHLEEAWKANPIDKTAEVGLQLALAICRWLPLISPRRCSVNPTLAGSTRHRPSLVPDFVVSSLIAKKASLQNKEQERSVNSDGSAESASFRLPVKFTSNATKTFCVADGNSMLNQYLILDDLGEGAQGKVQLAYDTINEEFRAIKTVREEKRAKLCGRGQLQQEIAVLKKLRHKNIVRLYEVIDDLPSQKLYLVLQFIEDGPVAKVSRGQDRLPRCDPISPSVLALYARQICSGLIYLHNHGIAHRDIKPDNLLIDKNQRVFISDFGVSELFEEKNGDAPMKSKLYILRGTPAFFAPEMLGECKESEVDTQAIDVWALGMTFFLLLCGHMPWSNSELKYEFHILSSPVEFPKDVPLEWRAIIEGMLKKNPSERVPLNNVRSQVKNLAARESRKADSVMQSDISSALTKLHSSTNCKKDQEFAPAASQTVTLFQSPLRPVSSASQCSTPKIMASPEDKGFVFYENPMTLEGPTKLRLPPDGSSISNAHELGNEKSDSDLRSPLKLEETLRLPSQDAVSKEMKDFEFRAPDPSCCGRGESRLLHSILPVQSDAPKNRKLPQRLKNPYLFPKPKMARAVTYGDT